MSILNKLEFESWSLKSEFAQAFFYIPSNRGFGRLQTGEGTSNSLN